MSIIDNLLTAEEIAPMAGWTVGSTRVLHQRAERRRRENRVQPGDMPAPDARFGRTPVWERSTIEKWLASRS